MRRVAWDSCVVLTYLEASDQNRMPTLDEMLLLAARGELTIVASVVAVTEVAFVAAERSGGLDPSRIVAIDAIWDGPIQIAEVHRPIAEHARALVREGLSNQRTLKAADAIHRATAALLGLDEFHSYDERILRWDTHLASLRVSEPYVDQPPLSAQT